MPSGPLGSTTNSPENDKGTLTRTRNTPRTITLEPIVIYLPPESFGKDDRFYKKMALGINIYQELGLAGQIAKKFIKLPYRKGGKINFETGKLEGQGLVCTSFANIFGALWFKGDPMGQEIMDSQEVKVRPRKKGEAGKPWKIVRKGTGKIIAEMDTKWEADASARDWNAVVVRPRRKDEAGKPWKIVLKGTGEIIAEMDTKWEADASARDRNEAANVKKKKGTRGIALSPGLVYGDKFGGVRVNNYRLKLKDLFERHLKENTTRLYAMVTYKKSKGANPLHVWFLMYAKSRRHWVRIEASGILEEKGRGAGPGIYKFDASSDKNYYQAWDWGPSNREIDTHIDNWDYIVRGKIKGHPL